jgi:hypothetical protein
MKGSKPNLLSNVVQMKGAVKGNAPAVPSFMSEGVRRI